MSLQHLLKATWGVIFAGLMGVSGCAPAPVQQEAWNPLDYTVKPGDTLYSIAWKYELDYKELARWNNIGPTYAIFPGQRLSMTPDDASGSYGHDVVTPDETEDVVAATLPESEPEPEVESESPVQPAREPSSEVVSRPDSVIVKSGDTLYSIARDFQIEPAQLARWNALRPPYALRAGQKLTLRPPGFAQAYKPPVAVVKPAEKQVVTASKPVANSKPKAMVSSMPMPSSFSWRWPVRGRVVKTFNPADTARKGIGIAGKVGQPIAAAAPGRVVYSGNGLISYGNLIIIKHNDEYLSAYAHNQDLLVSEGDEVAAGQTISSMGLDEGKARLHFEIRKQGKPVNPLKFLPSG